MRADTSDTLVEVRSNNKSPLSSILIDIQSYQIPRERPLEWIKHLECLFVSRCKELSHGESYQQHDKRTARPTRILLGRRCINPLNPYNRNYVVGSYTWEPSSKTKEDIAVGKYYIESMQTQGWGPSVLRNIVLDRVVKYAEYCGCELFWIDRECVDQKDYVMKEAAIQSMDQVYCLSEFPVGLLSTRIESEDDMNLLIKFLYGIFIERKEKAQPPVFKPEISPAQVSKVLRLLTRLTSDEWWTRAWIFQEDYLSSIKMVLLIPHEHSLEAQKRQAHKLIGDLPGELCVNSAKFRERATEFCLAYQKQQEHGHGEETCKTIIDRAGKYTALLRRTNKDRDRIWKPMSPTIFADIGSRDITNCSDSLAIAANCCRYPVRLDTHKLSSKNYSLSLCLLTLWLLNGEIPGNNKDVDRTALSDNIFDFLKKQSLNSFQPPVLRKQLTFIKSCRFVTVKLVKEGIKTVGHLWKLGKVIETRRFARKLPYHKDSHGCSNRKQRQRLRQLANELSSGCHGRRYLKLANDIERYLLQDLHPENKTFSKAHKDLMAGEVVQAIESGKNLHLARLVPISHEKRLKYAHSPYRGIFIKESGVKWTTNSYVFTASSPAGESLDKIAKHVSLKVNCCGSTRKGLPRLIITKWINGLCFFDGCPSREVVFPWPTPLIT